MKKHLRTLAACSFLWVGTQSASADQLQCQQLPELLQVFTHQHYAYREATDTIRNQAVEQFIKAIDPSKTLLLEGDAVSFRKTVPPLFRDMKDGKCGLLDDVYNVLLMRSQENEATVRELLGPKYKLDETIEIQMDPDRRGYARTSEDRKKLIRGLTHFQISSALLVDPSVEKAKTQIIHRFELATKRARERGASELITTFAEAFARALDPHTSYLSQDNFEDFNIQMGLSLQGIGVSLTSQDGYVVVEDIIPGGSADRMGVLKPKDKIISVSQPGEKSASVIDMDLREVVKLIRGKKGTKVKLTVLRQGEKTETFETTIVRDKINIEEAAAKLTFEERTLNGKKLKLGILDLPSFYGGRDSGAKSAYADVRNLLGQAKKAKVDGLILDLSRNGGGLLEDAVRISGFFLKKGPVVATQDTHRRKDILSDTDSEVLYSGPLVVLTSRLSASASEILAGALKDYKRALIVGADHTFGKGTVQVLQPLPLELGAMKVTTGMYFLPKGLSTQHRGVAADVVLPSLFSTDDIGEKTLDYSLPQVSIDAFFGNEVNGTDPSNHYAEVDSALVTRLAQASTKRVAADSKFQELRKEIADMEKNRGPVKLSDLRKKSEAEKKKEDKDEANGKAKGSKRKRRGDTDTPQLQEALRILGDWLAPTA